MSHRERTATSEPKEAAALGRKAVTSMDGVIPSKLLYTPTLTQRGKNVDFRFFSFFAENVNVMSKVSFFSLPSDVLLDL